MRWGEVAGIQGGEEDGVSVRSRHGSQPASDSRAAGTYAEKCKHLLVSGETETYGSALRRMGDGTLPGGLRGSVAG